MNRIDLIRGNILKAIAESGQSRLKVTEKAGISYQHLTRFLNNNTGGEIGIGILCRLAEVLDVPVSCLLGDTDKAGDYILTAGGRQLPAEWDGLMKEILAMDEKERDKIYRMLNLLLEVIK